MGSRELREGTGLLRRTSPAIRLVRGQPVCVPDVMCVSPMW